MCVTSVSNFNCRRKGLVGPTQSNALQHLTHNLTLQCVRDHGALIRQNTISVSVARDSWEFPVWVVKRCDHIGRIQHQKFFPYRPLILLAHSVWIRRQPLRLSEICEFLVMKSRCCAEWPGRNDIA